MGALLLSPSAPSSRDGPQGGPPWDPFWHEHWTWLLAGPVRLRQGARLAALRGGSRDRLVRLLPRTDDRRGRGRDQLGRLRLEARQWSRASAHEPVTATSGSPRHSVARCAPGTGSSRVSWSPLWARSERYAVPVPVAVAATVRVPAVAAARSRCCLREDPIAARIRRSA